MNPAQTSSLWFILLMFATLTAHACASAPGTALEFGDKTITVKKGGDFQAALERAQPGDTILLEAGATFSGAFTLPRKSGAEFVTVRSADESAFPAPGIRMDPEKFKLKLAKIASNVRGEPSITASEGSHHYRFIGVEFGPTIEGLYDIIKIGTGNATGAAQLPHHIEFDRVWIHGSPVFGQRRGIAANGRNIRIVNSYISDIKRKGDESQAIAAWATDGPIEIVNNYLEAAAQSVLFGGAGSALKLVPTDCIVDSNHMNKPVAWKDTDWVVKNIFEIKNGRRIKVTNNLMTNNWAMGQDGNAILFTTRADNGDATIIEDIEFSGNIVRGTGGGMNILGTEGSGGHRLTVRNNIFDDIDGRKWGGGGHFMKVTQWDGLTIENNTVLQGANITNSYGQPVTKFVFRNNIVLENEYGFHGEDVGTGQKAIDKFYPGGTVTGNIIVGGSSGLYKEPNIYVKSLDQIGFDPSAPGAYKLRSGSPYLKAGADGKPIGAIIDPAGVGHK